ncbi:MAG: ferredoxin [bacterium]
MIKIDKEKCIGCATCTAICPSNFAIGDDGKSKVISQKESECLFKVKELCPAQAISID